MIVQKCGWFSLLFLWVVFPSLASAVVTEIGPSDDIRAAIAALQPGDELVLQGGTYDLGGSSFRITVNGTSTNPIIIRAKDGERPLINQPTVSQNIIEISNSQYLEIKEVAFSGGSAGVRLMNSDFITIEGCEIFDTNDTALNANSGGTYEGLRILRNHIHHTDNTGEGMYLGCNNDACRVANSLIEGNYVHHTNGPGVSQGDGIELKEGSYGNIIRNNVVHDTNYPGILVYSTVGNGAANVIEGNIIWNTNDYAIQAAADAIIRNNIILSSSVGFQSHQAGSPSNMEFVNNTIITSDNGLEIRSVSGPVLVANNAIYSQGTAIRLVSGDISQVTVSGNVGQGGTQGVSSGYTEGGGLSADFVSANFSASLPIDVFPRVGSALIGAANVTHLPTLDFNGDSRGSSADVGAYLFNSSGNPGWTIIEGFKTGGGGGGNTTTPDAPANLRLK